MYVNIISIVNVDVDAVKTFRHRLLAKRKSFTIKGISCGAPTSRLSKQNFRSNLIFS